MTERDQRFLMGLGNYGVLSTRQITELFFQRIRKTTVLRRLRLLEKKKVIRRIQGLPDGALAWCLTASEAHRLGLDFAFGRSNRNTIEHDVLLNDIRVSLRRVGLGEKWVPEHVLRRQSSEKQRYVSKEERFIPDGLLTVDEAKTSKEISVELELHAKSRRRYRQILGRYRWNPKLWAVWYIVPTESLGRLIDDEWHRVSHGKSDLVMWSLLSEVLGDPWNVRIHIGLKAGPLRNYIDMINPGALGGAHPQSSTNAARSDHAPALAC